MTHITIVYTVKPVLIDILSIFYIVLFFFRQMEQATLTLVCFAT